MKNISVKIIPQLKDNYSYILKTSSESDAIIIDPADAKPHFDFLEKNNLKVDSILLTHHHNDHVAGVKDLVNDFPLAKVYSPNKSIIETTNLIQNNELIQTTLNEFIVISTPGHTSDHVVYYDKKNEILFSGDTLFRLGCGRIFEGTFEEMFSSLQKINNLPNSTLVYCGHEYTLNNLLFLENVIGNSKTLEKTRLTIENKIKEDFFSIPFNLGFEKDINPFLNQNSDYLKKLKKSNDFSNFEMFKFIRKKKDDF